MNKHRIERSATIRLEAPIEKVFPLFGPIREKDWAQGWDPEIIFSNHPLVEKHMVFRTKSEEHEIFTWVIVNYEPGSFMIEYMVSAVDRIWFITVKCEPANNQTLATITYSYTGFNEEANQKNQNALNRMFSRNLLDWQEPINQYLSNY